MGNRDKVRKHELFPNITIKQYKPNLSLWDVVPLVPAKVFPFRVDMMPIHLDMIVDMLYEQPDIVHTFQTFGATDISGFVAAYLVKQGGKDVRLINTIMTEIDTYFGSYIRNISNCSFEQIKRKSFMQILKDSSRAGSPAASYEGNVSIGKAIAHAVPLAFWYGLAKAVDALGKRESFINMISGAFRKFLEAEIPAYMNRCDAITVSRPDDVSRYHLKTPAWDVPLTCDLERFQVYDQSVSEFLARVDLEYCAGRLSLTGATELRKFATDNNIADRRTILYVGRLSDEKNVSLLIDNYERLLKEEGMKGKVYFVFIGAGEKERRINELFGDDATVTGLVPNSLLPDIYNFVRQRGGYFISASDTETYGLTHEEARACGMPTVAMQAGTRSHIFCPGDMIGQVPLDKDHGISIEIEKVTGSNYVFTPGLNGLLVPDYSDGHGLSALGSGHVGVSRARESIYQAMRTMALLPDSTVCAMAEYSAELTERNRLGWKLTWSLFSRAVYVNNRPAHNAIYLERAHSF